MLTPGSRYDGVAVAETTITGPDGVSRTVRYLRRRFLPRVEDHTTLVEHRVAPGERLDVIAARYLTDPTRFWLLCDANPVLRPEELEAPGRTIVVAMPGR